MQANPLWHPSNAEEDRRWVRLCQNGEDAAFESLVCKYQKPLCQLVYRHVGDPAEVEDIVQKILSKVYFTLAKFDPERPFFPWLYRIAVNQCYDELRRVRRQRTLRFADLNLRSGESLEILMNQCRTPPSSEEKREQLHRLLYTMLDRLSEKQRKVIALRDLEQIGYPELSNILGCTERAARLKVFRARARLRDLMLKELKKKDGDSRKFLESPRIAAFSGGRDDPRSSPRAA